VTMFFGLGFLDRYTWLRDASGLVTALTVTGALMVITGGLLSVFQRHLGRILGYAVIVETGFSLLALTLGTHTSTSIFLLLLVPRALGLITWALALSLMKERTSGLTFSEIKGMGHNMPFTASALLLANLALAGMPLLAGFPAHQAIWEGLAHSSLILAFWVLVGSLGLFASAVRALAALVMAPEVSPWQVREAPIQRLLLMSGSLLLFLLGLFPQWLLPLWTKLPVLFEHLGQ
jgi:NADH-quinone oxidoreductase subunit N